MAVYVFLFAAAILAAVPLIMKNPTKTKKAVYVSVMFVLLYLVSVFRYGIGNDYFSYIRILREISEADFGSMLSLGYEPLFTLLTKLISLVTEDPEIMYAVYALFILGPVAWAIYKYSDNVWLSVAVYLCFTLFYNSLNFIRQSMAVSVIILAYGFMKKRKIVPVLLLGIAAAMLHYTALVFIPLYLLSLIRPTKKYLIIYGSVSVGALAVCLIMKAAGANPLHIIAQLLTAITGKGYEGYAGSIWFETGFGPEYLIMPLTLLAVVLVSYYCGWRERPEADMLLQLTLFNATIWSFIIYAFIVERLSMFIFIFAVFTVPSVTEHFAEKARELEKKKKNGKKTPGYSKKNAEDKKDSSFLLTVGITIGMFIYNCFGMAMNFHGVFPYVFMFPAVQDAYDGLDGAEKNLKAMYSGTDLYSYLIELKNADCGYIIASTGDQFGFFTPAVRRADEYAQTKLCSSLIDTADSADGMIIYRPSGDAQAQAYNAYSGKDGGATVIDEEGNICVVDKAGTTIKVHDNKLVFFLLDENGKFFDATEFDVSAAKRDAVKIRVTLD